MRDGLATTRRTRMLALAIALAGLALTTYVAAVLTQSTARDLVGWFAYEAIAWFALPAAAWLAGDLVHLRSPGPRP